VKKTTLSSGSNAKKATMGWGDLRFALNEQNCIPGDGELGIEKRVRTCLSFHNWSARDIGKVIRSLPKLVIIKEGENGDPPIALVHSDTRTIAKQILPGLQ